MKQIKLMQGDNILSLKKLPENSIDSVVTDPPYGLSFMNKKWDYEVPSVEFWKEVLRVLKPGGHVLSFGGTRTFHRMVVNMEDAGFEIRDQIMWIYGSGFPKSLNIGKAFDKKSGNEREEYIDEDFIKRNPNNTGCNTLHHNDKDGITQNKNETAGIKTKGNSQYEGWGTALKPANEPICLARKPLSEKTIVDNVIKWGTGGINVDGCRIDLNGDDTSRKITDNKNDINIINSKNVGSQDDKWKEGRFPANILFDEEAAQVLDNQSGNIKSTGSTRKKENEYDGTSYKGKNELGKSSNPYAGENGGASRFFYVAKVSKKERNLGLDDFEEKETTGQINCMKCENCNKYYQAGDGRELCKCDEPKLKPPVTKNFHPTLKPINLMTYLCRLVTPPGGIVLDPFMGSGSTGISACLEGFRFVGMELDEDYFKIAEARINNFEEYRKLLK